MNDRSKIIPLVTPNAIGSSKINKIYPVHSSLQSARLHREGTIRIDYIAGINDNPTLRIYLLNGEQFANVQLASSPGPHSVLLNTTSNGNRHFGKGVYVIQFIAENNKQHFLLHPEP